MTRQLLVYNRAATVMNHKAVGTLRLYRTQKQFFIHSLKHIWLTTLRLYDATIENFTMAATSTLNSKASKLRAILRRPRLSDFSLVHMSGVLLSSNSTQTPYFRSIPHGIDHCSRPTVHASENAQSTVVTLSPSIIFSTQSESLAPLGFIVHQ